MVAAKLETPIHIALSYDEEVGCIGVRRLLDLMKNMPVVPSMAIIGEPTNMEIVGAHKGKRAIRVNVRGASAHSAYPTEGVNAVEVAAQLVAHICEVQEKLRKMAHLIQGFESPIRRFMSELFAGAQRSTSFLMNVHLTLRFAISQNMKSIH